ncbi:MAG TPA: pyridoxamine 5'-phosphate oxidase family protein [Streptosporangiaceae bacterium]|nr:pyridoxamine 5'-phosphate oxidase family protein [Streptosporangiaceae bacterium]
MARYPTDHAGLAILPLEECLRLLQSVPVGRVGFQADGEVVVLPVNYVVRGQTVAFRTAIGSKLSAAEGQSNVVFEADDYDPGRRAGWSVVLNGHAQLVYEDAEIEALDRLGLVSWADQASQPFWIRIRPESVSGRLITSHGSLGSQSAGEVPLPRGTALRDDTPLQVFNVLRGEANHIRSTPFGDVGTVFSGRSMELVWVSKHGEPVDESWFRMKAVDLIMVLQGQLKCEFESPDHHDRVLGAGELLVLPAEARCRAYRWPRDAAQATIFVAAYSPRDLAGHGKNNER